MTDQRAKPPRNPALLVLIPMAIIAAVIASFAAYFLWPRGQRIGALDLVTPTPSLPIELQAGDKLSFRLDVIVGTDSSYPSSSRSRHNAVHDQLEASVITLALAKDGAAESSTQCAAYDDKATTVSSTDTEVDSSGLPLKCTLVATERGKHMLTASVAWAPKDVRKATLEVRRERAD